MEEKHFPWLLKLLNSSKSCIRILETYPVQNSRILCSFSNGINNQVRQIPRKFLKFTNIQNFLLVFLKKIDKGIPRSKKIYFIRSDFREEVSLSHINELQNFDFNSPKVSFIQISNQIPFRFLTMRIEYSKNSYKYSFTPNRSISQPILDQADSVFKNLLFYIQKSEKKEVLLMELEFLEDSSHILWLSILKLCYIIPKEDLITFHRSMMSILVPTAYKQENYNRSENSKSKNRCSSKPMADLNLKLYPRLNSSFDSDESKSAERPLAHTFRQIHPKNSKNFIELLSRTRLAHYSSEKRLGYTDEEYLSEFQKMDEVLNGCGQSYFKEKKSFSPNLEIPPVQYSRISAYSPNSAIHTVNSSARGFRSTPILKSRIGSRQHKPYKNMLI